MLASSQQLNNTCGKNHLLNQIQIWHRWSSFCHHHQTSFDLKITETHPHVRRSQRRIFYSMLTNSYSYVWPTLTWDRLASIEVHWPLVDQDSILFLGCWTLVNSAPLTWNCRWAFDWGWPNFNPPVLSFQMWKFDPSVVYLTLTKVDNFYISSLIALTALTWYLLRSDLESCWNILIYYL